MFAPFTNLTTARQVGGGRHQGLLGFRGASGPSLVHETASGKRNGGSGEGGSMGSSLMAPMLTGLSDLEFIA